MRWITLATLVCFLASCANRNQLPERHARHTAEALIAAEGPKLRDFHHMEWRGLRQVSPTEAYGTAALVYRFPLPDGGMGEELIQGKFMYQNLPDKGWTLVAIEFPNPNNLYHSVNEEVFVKVSSANVALGDSLSRPRTPSASAQGGLEDDSLVAARPDIDSVAGSGVPAIPLSLARRTADRSLLSMSTGGRRWKAKAFGQVAMLDAENAELGAVLENAPATPEYRGAFHYAYDPDTRRWYLTGMAFHGEGVDPIERQFQPPLPVE